MADRSGEHFGNYRLVRLLGQGGFAEVYLGQHLRLNQQAAIKVLQAECCAAMSQRYFKKKARTLSSLRHPHHRARAGLRRGKRDPPFLVMDYAPDGTLRQLLPRGGPAAPDPCRALRQANRRGSPVRPRAPGHPPRCQARQHARQPAQPGPALRLRHRHRRPQHRLAQCECTGAVWHAGLHGPGADSRGIHARPVTSMRWAWWSTSGCVASAPFEGSASEVMAQHLSMPPLPLRERVPALPPEVEQVVLRALAKDPKARFASVAALSAALEQASQRALSPTAQLGSSQPARNPAAAPGYDTAAVAPSHPVLPTEATPSADLPAEPSEPTVYPGSFAPNGLDTPQSGTASEVSLPGQVVVPTAAVVPTLLEPTIPVKQKAKRLPRTSAALLVRLVVVVVAGGILGSLSLLAHFGVLVHRKQCHHSCGARRYLDSRPLLRRELRSPPMARQKTVSALLDQALYLPLFYGDAQGVVHPGAATELPTIQNGGISPDAKTWTFHLRPHLVWSDGQPYDARDVDYTWQLWKSPSFGAALTQGVNLVSSAMSQRTTSHSLPPHAHLCSFPLVLGGWHLSPTTSTPFQGAGTTDHPEIFREPEPASHERPFHDE